MLQRLYNLCRQTVTIYHLMSSSPDFICKRTVFRGAFLDFKKVSSVDRTGRKETTGYLLILPSGNGRPEWVPPEEFDAMEHPNELGYPEAEPIFTIKAMDKVVLGEGPEITTREEWAAMLPTQTPGLVVAKNIDVKFWDCAVCHVEVSG